MGLDMYLSKKHYVKNWDHAPERKFKIAVNLNEKGYSPVNPEKVAYIQEEVGYWRKQNHIHQWFVDNVQGGKDECQVAYVDPAKLQELLETCKRSWPPRNLLRMVMEKNSSKIQPWQKNYSRIKVVSFSVELNMMNGISKA
jgi:hypothetical protein